MHAFAFNTTQSLIHEPGASRRLVELCRDRGAQRVFLVTAPGLVSTGLLDPVLAGFGGQSVAIETCTEVIADPPDTIVKAAVTQAEAMSADLIVGFGGGGSMDVAKVVALLASPDCDQTLEDLYGVGNARGRRLPLIQVPTTAGTGSEVTPISIITTGATTKSGIVSPILLPDLAVLDPDLTLGLPPHVTAATGIDAMVHAIEAYTSKIRKNPVSDMLARRALELLGHNVVTAVKDGHNREARSAMLLGAFLAGQAFANAPVAAVHALAYPLGGHFHIPHGLSNSLVLPPVLRFNAPQAAPLYAELAPLLPGDHPASADGLIKSLENLIAVVELPTRLRDMEIPDDFLPRLAADAMLQERLLVNNPREVTESDALYIYQSVY